jgi:hypothetical protein
MARSRFGKHSYDVAPDGFGVFFKAFYEFSVKGHFAGSALINKVSGGKKLV